jgi:hypothetical protein
MENVGLFYDNLKYFSAIWYNLWPFGVACCHFVYFSGFDMCLDQKKSGSSE